MDDELASRVEEYRWFHSIDLGGGVVTPGCKSPVICAAEAAAVFDRLGLNGRSAVDVGAFNGACSFEAKRRCREPPSSAFILRFSSISPTDRSAIGWSR